MARAPKFESDDPTLVQALRSAAPERVELVSSVMQRITEFRSLQAHIAEHQPPQMPHPISFSESVMQRVAATKQPVPRLVVDEEADAKELTTVRSLRWLTYVGTAVAAGLMVALFYAPISDWLSSKGPVQNQTRAASSPSATPNNVQDLAARNSKSIGSFAPMTGQIRSSRDYQGEPCWVTDIGLVEGLRVGDVLTWYESEKPVGQLRIIGVSAFASIAKLESQTTKTPQFQDHVQTTFVTDAMRRARERLQSGNEGGAFYGLGVVVTPSEQGLMIEEVIRELWPAELSRSQPSLAAKLGLEPGDLVLSVQGQKVVSLADFERALSRVSPDSGVLSVDILRNGGTPMSLHER